MKVLFNREVQRVPIFMWTNEDFEEGALAQAMNLATLPFAHHHIALMPDCHQGYGMPIGGVLATEGVIVPNAVGVDIGCGMCAQKLPLTMITREQLKQAMGIIRQTIPVGFNHHKVKQDLNFMPQENVIPPIVMSEYEHAREQIGTLGGGNHFIEIQRGSDGFIWIMIHSGSRNLGYKIANYYNEGAKQMNKRWHASVPEKADLAFLPLGTEEGLNYSNEMNYCVAFALANRKLMMDRAILAVGEACKGF
jgi:tRNA-splicing ligase RtcB